MVRNVDTWSSNKEVTMKAQLRYSRLATLLVLVGMLLPLALPTGGQVSARHNASLTGSLQGPLPSARPIGSLDVTVPVDITAEGLSPRVAEAAVGETVEWTNQTTATVHLITGWSNQVFLPSLQRAQTATSAVNGLLAPPSAAVSPQESWIDVAIPAGGTHTHLFPETGRYRYHMADNQSIAESRGVPYSPEGFPGDNGWVDVRPTETVSIPAGEFIMGCYGSSTWELCQDDEWPTHTVYLDAFYIDETEVTNAQYAQCVTDGSCPPHGCSGSRTRTSYYCNNDYANYPMVLVDWEEAAAYCAWAGKRLPTEAEWEKAARGTDRRAFPWGNSDPECWKANFVAHPPTYCEDDTTEVGSYPSGASPYGALDMAGNVAEWVSDWYDADFYDVSPYSNPQGPAGEFQDPYTTKVTRGGQFDFYWAPANTSNRDDEYYHGGWYTLGFRCAGSVGQ
jgi:formylglycine-generating enzyme required for sulfatase activity